VAHADVGHRAHRRARCDPTVRRVVEVVTQKFAALQAHRRLSEAALALMWSGGFALWPRHRAAQQLQHLTLAEREEISRGRAAPQCVRSWPAGWGGAPSTISREVTWHGSATGYRACVIDAAASVHAPAEAMPAGPGAAFAAGGRAETARGLVPAAHRRLALAHLP
jgi:hypothetical protein